ncbi:MAG: AAA family ATPase [Pseudomonadota bacterium]
MRRVMIVGGPGSGKSTLARALGERTGLAVHHMDHIHWMPGWQQRPREARRIMATEIENSDHWIFEGGFSTTFEHRASRADTLIWLDLPAGLRIWRVTKRLVRHWGRGRPDMAPGCIEGLHGETFAFYIYIWRTRQSHRARLQTLIDTHPHLSVHHLRSFRAVDQYLNEVAR